MYVYHRKPQKLEGKILLPLNELRSKYPEIFDLQSGKYEGREELMNRKIPILNCLWNDVIHLAPIHPEHVYLNLAKVGFNPRKSTWFRWPAEILSNRNAVYYKGPMSRSPLLEQAHFSEFQIQKFQELYDLPEKTKKHYGQAKENNERPLMFLGCPHILLKGHLEISAGEEIMVDA